MMPAVELSLMITSSSPKIQLMSRVGVSLDWNTGTLHILELPAFPEPR